MASQLSRRRGGGSGNASNVQQDGHSASSSPTPELGGSAFAFNNSTSGSHKIAYDPRDLTNSDSSDGSGKIPQLTLMEEVLLLGIKDKQGYLSFWNDNISYALRGAILIELALRRRIGIVREPGGRRRSDAQLSDKLLEVLSAQPTGETLLDETLKMMKAHQEASTPEGGGEKLSVGTWVDLLSGETWNVMKIGFQLKQVRERLAKGLVDKGVLRTEKRNFLLFDMATHPVADGRIKDTLLRRLSTLLTATTSTVPAAALQPEGTSTRHIRSVCLSSCAYAASVLDNVFIGVGYEEQEAAFSRAEEILAEFSVWPWGGASSSGESAMKSKRRAASRIASGSGGTDPSRESVLGLLSECRKESICEEGIDEDGSLELIASVLEVLGRLDSLL